MRQFLLNFPGRNVKTQYEPCQTRQTTRTSKLDTEKFYKLTRDVRLDPLNPMANIGWKREILEQCNYPRLTVSKDGGMSVHNVRWKRIGSAFRDIYQRVENTHTTTNT